MPLTIQRTEATLGAYITGVDLADLDERSFEEIRAAFLEYGVLIFPGQNLSAEDQVAFASRFGEIEVLVDDLKTTPITNVTADGSLADEESQQMQILLGNEMWHTDSSYMPVSAKASVLSAQVVPSSGGQTEWADMRAAYDDLDEVTRERIEKLAAYHSLLYSRDDPTRKAEERSGYGFYDGAPQLRPLTKVHPETGRTALYIGRHAHGIPGLDPDESESLLAQLVSFACQPPRVFAHTWAPGDVAIWDNRCVMHRARPYDHAEQRVMMHTRIKGDPESEAALAA
ncbi:MAG: TauD/TfdA dioxygenase family protein [Gammaproteobacteria bacterium]